MLQEKMKQVIHYDEVRSVPIEDKINESHLKLYGHVNCKTINLLVRMMDLIHMEGDKRINLIQIEGANTNVKAKEACAEERS